MAYEIRLGKTAIDSTPFNTLSGYVILLTSGTYVRKHGLRGVEVAVRAFHTKHMGFFTQRATTDHDRRRSRSAYARASAADCDAAGLDFFIEIAKKGAGRRQLAPDIDCVRDRRACV